MDISDSHEYQFIMHCPYPTGYNEGIQELAHSYKQPGGKVDFDPATCDQFGQPKPGQSGPCMLKWPEVLRGGWSDPETGQVTWALCQKQCPPPPPPPPPAPPPPAEE
jgi:hypothetical protein